MTIGKRTLAPFLCLTLVLGTFPLESCKKSVQQNLPEATAPTATYAVPTEEQLYQLVAPIALFPDNLVAQVLAGSTYPDQIASANQWLRANPGLSGAQLMQAADGQPWDNSVKGLTQFPDVLNQMATNISWTSALGDAYFNVPQSVMNAVQVMRKRAYEAGNLKTNEQQNVAVQAQAPAAAPAAASSGAPQVTIVQAPPQTIVIQPAQPQVVYVPTYNPAVVYGAPVAPYPGYSSAAVASVISFGVGIAIGVAMSNNSCCGWGWNSWGCSWHNSTVIYNRNIYVSTSNTFVNRNNYYNHNINNANINKNINRNINRNNLNSNNRTNNFNGSSPNFDRTRNQAQFSGGAGSNRGTLAQGRSQSSAARTVPSQSNRGALNQNRAASVNASQRPAARGYGQQADRGTSSGAFSNYGQGGNARTNSARGEQSLGGRRSSPTAAPRSQPSASRSQPRASGRRH